MILQPAITLELLKLSRIPRIRLRTDPLSYIRIPLYLFTTAHYYIRWITRKPMLHYCSTIILQYLHAKTDKEKEGRE